MAFLYHFIYYQLCMFGYFISCGSYAHLRYILLSRSVSCYGIMMYLEYTIYILCDCVCYIYISMEFEDSTTQLYCLSLLKNQTNTLNACKYFLFKQTRYISAKYVYIFISYSALNALRLYIVFFKYIYICMLHHITSVLYSIEISCALTS